MKSGPCKYPVCSLPAAFSPHTDRTVISSRAPSSPSPRAHKSSWSAVTSPRPHGSWMALRLPLYPRFPGGATQPRRFPLLLYMEPIVDVSFTHKNKRNVKTRGVFLCCTSERPRALLGLFSFLGGRYLNGRFIYKRLRGPVYPNVCSCY